MHITDMLNAHTRVWWPAMAIAGLGCMGEKAAAPTLRPADETLGVVTVSPANAIVAVGGTVSLSVAAQSLIGTPMTEFDSVRYTMNSLVDTVRVRLAPDGTVT